LNTIPISIFWYLYYYQIHPEMDTTIDIRLYLLMKILLFSFYIL